MGIYETLDDVQGKKGSTNEPIHMYLHTYCGDAEELYRNNIYRFGI